MRFSYLTLTSVSFALLAAACSSSTEPGSEAPIGEVSTAATTGADDVQACSKEFARPSGSLSDNLCSGFWEYPAPCYTFKNSADCGTEAWSTPTYVTKKLSCQKPSCGPVNPPRQKLRREEDTRSVYFHPEGSDAASCKDVMIKDVIRTARRMYIYNEPADPVTEADWKKIYPFMDWSPYSSRIIPNTSPEMVHCVYDINVAVFNSCEDLPNENYCGTTSVPSGTSSISLSCRLKAHGLANASQCDEPPLRSEIGLSLEGLKERNPDYTDIVNGGGASKGYAAATCVTCDETPLPEYTTPPPDQAELDRRKKAVQGRYECLYRSLVQHTVDDGAGYRRVASETNIATRVVKNMKLLAEMRGEYLEAGQRDEIQKLYLYTVPPDCDQNRPAQDGAAACGTLLRSNASAANVSKALGSFEYCDAMRVHGTGTTLLANQSACLDAYKTLTNFRGGDAAFQQDYNTKCRPLAPAKWDVQYVSAASQRVTGTVPTSNDPAAMKQLQSDVQARLAAIDAWYVQRIAAIKAVLADMNGQPPGQIAAKKIELLAEMRADLDEMLGRLWATVYGLSGVPTTTTRSDLASVNFELDRRILLAALTPYTPPGSTTSTGLPMPHGPLLYVLSDALQGMSGRLRTMSGLHDLGCRFRSGGCAAGARSTQVSELYRIISAIPDSTTLSTAIDAASHLATDPWREAFTALKTGHSTFEAAVLDALDPLAPPTDYKTEMVSASSNGQPRPINALSGIVSDAKIRTDHYTTVGLFETGNPNVIHGSFTKETRDAWLAQLDSDSATLKTERDRYVAKESEYLETQIKQVQQQGSLEGVKAKLAANTTRRNQLLSDLGGLRDNVSRNEMQFGDFVAAYNTLLKEEKEQADYAFDPKQLATFLVNPKQHAIYQPGTFQIGQWAIPGVDWSQDVGEITNLQVSGTWAPVCALKGLKLPDGKTMPDAELDGLRTGPEGFSLSFTNSGFKATSHSTVDSVQDFRQIVHRNSECESGNFTGGISITQPVNYSVTYSNSLTDCVDRSSGTTYTHAVTDTDGSGGEMRTSASFVGGVRAPNTPFPRAPAGALLAVALKPGKIRLDDDESRPLNGNGRNVVDVRVIQSPNTALMYPEPVRVYLVVNDSGQCGASANTQSLTVTPFRLKAAIKLLEAFAKPLSEVHKWLRSERPRLVAQGQLTSTDTAQLQAQAYQKLTTGCHCNFNQYPHFVQGFFSEWLAKEIAQIDRFIAIQTKERELRLLDMDYAALTTEYESEERQGRLRTVVANIQARNLDSYQLDTFMRTAAARATQWVYPILQLRHPKALVALAQDSTFNDKLNLLIDSVWSTPAGASASSVGELAQRETDVLARMAQTIRNVVLNDRNDPILNEVVVRIPRVLDVNDPNAACTPFPRPGDLPHSSWKAIGSVSEPDAQGKVTIRDCAKARRMWADLLNPAKKTVTIELSPEDVYVATGGPAPLICNVAAPLITHMAVYLGTDMADSIATSLNSQALAPAMLARDRMLFPLKTGVESYDVDSALLYSQGRFLFGKGDNALDTFSKIKTQSPQTLTHQAGFSPFTAFTFATELLHQNSARPLDEAYELDLVFNIDPSYQTSSSGNVKGVPQCQ
ncbi:hypothetical protein LZC95_25335 [Pendulispora brunnea]|uniref:Uncharacterized protein n=1 Tax=Pendulispora brunnea TaxID=2905690 RepID=A0ABZ2KNM3_9BACT